MPRHFTIPTMLRMTPNTMLQTFFQRLGIQLLSIDWRRLGERQVEPLLRTLSWLPREQQEQAESSLACIFELACETGWQAIRDAARDAGEPQLAGLMPGDACYYERAMWTWLERPGIFEQAALRQQIHGLTRWRKRTGLPVSTPRITPDSIRELTGGLSQCLRREEGRGQNCSIDYFRQANGTDIFVAYPDDFMRTVTTHDAEGRLVPRPIRPTFEIVFALRADEGTLELFAKVAPALKPKLECVFGQIILGADLGFQPSSRPFDLNRLKDRYFCLSTDPSDHVSASISRLRLSVPNYGWLTVEPKGQRTPGDIYEVIDDCLNDETVHWHEVEINLATFRFELEALPSRRATTISLDVTYPDRCSIKSRRPEPIELARKYLRRWRIANV
jgi:hypothetical protein